MYQKLSAPIRLARSRKRPSSMEVTITILMWGYAFLMASAAVRPSESFSVQMSIKIRSICPSPHRLSAASARFSAPATRQSAHFSAQAHRYILASA